MSKKSIIMIIAIILVVVLIGLVTFGFIRKLTNKVENPIATIEVQGYEEKIVVELYPEYALNTVRNFIALANSGFYNGLIVHRVEKDFVIQTGDPNGNGSGGPSLSAIDSSIEKGSEGDKEYQIDGEFNANGYNNNLKHERGIVSMARSTYSSTLVKESYNSAGSQFFICLKDSPTLNGMYTAFGKVISGMDTVDKISQVELGVEKDDEGTETPTSKPKEDVVITSITVDTKGKSYEKPETHEAFDYYTWYMKTYYGM